MHLRSEVSAASGTQISIREVFHYFGQIERREGLCVDSPETAKNLLPTGRMIDGYSNELFFVPSTGCRGVDVVSSGADGLRGTQDDIQRSYCTQCKATE